MNQDQWTAVDRYITDKLVPPDAILDEAMKANAAAGLPSIDVSAAQGKLLHVLALARGARRILEIGTLGGYSTIWLARALPADGRLVTLELAAEACRGGAGRIWIARDFRRFGGDFASGPAAESLAQLCKEGAEPFDLIFIDADKKSIPLTWAGRCSWPDAGR